MVTIRINPACEHAPDVEQCPICRAKLVDKLLGMAEAYEKAELPERAARALALAEQYDGDPS
jgi:hypothetical protein